MEISTKIRKMIMAKTSTGVNISIDVNSIEAYTTPAPESKDYVEVYMKSGRTFILSPDVDQDMYEGDSLVTLLDRTVWCGDNEVVE